MSPIKMLQTKNQFAELLSLTQLYLVREFELHEKTSVDHQTFQQLKKLKPHAKEVEIKKTPPPPVQVFSPPQPLRAPLEKIIAPPPSPPTSEDVVLKPKTPPPINPTPIHTHPEKKQFALDPLEGIRPNTADLSFKEMIEAHFPQVTLMEIVPDDQIAKQEKDAWRTKQEVQPIVILSFHEDSHAMNLLQNLCKAINLCLAPAKILNGLELEKQQQWEKILSKPELRFVISGDYGLYMQPTLMKHYHQDPKTGTHYLNRTPLLLLSDISLYLKKPELKALLWNAICNEIRQSTK